MILSVALYRCKTDSVILREEHGLGVLMNIAPRKSGSKREEVTGRKKLHTQNFTICTPR